MCQLHISLTRAAQIYLELHFCVELHTKKSPGRIYSVYHLEREKMSGREKRKLGKVENGKQQAGTNSFPGGFVADLRRQ